MPSFKGLCVMVFGLLSVPSDAQGVAKRFPDQQSPFICKGSDSRDVLAALLNNGADLSRPREASFYFYGPADRMPGLQRDLEHLGFSVVATRTDPGRIATIVAVTDENWLAILIPKLCDIASKHRSEYDGWEASVS